MNLFSLILGIIGTITGITSCVMAFTSNVIAGYIVGGVLLLLSFLYLASLLFERKKKIKFFKYIRWKTGKNFDGYEIIKRETIYKINSQESECYTNIIHGKAKKDFLESTYCTFTWDQDEDFVFEKDEGCSDITCTADGSSRTAYYKFKDALKKGDVFQSKFEINNLKTSKQNFKNHCFLDIKINKKRTKILEMTCLIKKDLNPINFRFMIKDGQGNLLENTIIPNPENIDNEGYLVIKKTINYPDPNYSYMIKWDCIKE